MSLLRLPGGPADRALFLAFLGWLGIGLVCMAARIDADALAGLPLPGWAEAFAAACLRVGDPVLIVLAALNTHRALRHAWGGRAAWRWLLAAVVLGAAVEFVGTRTGFPFGAYAYTDAFGPRLGPLPLAIPLAWYVVSGNALLLWRAAFPGWFRLVDAAGTGGLVALFDALMEPFATQVRGYWVWGGNGEPPPRNYLAWAVVAGLLVLGFAPPQAGGEREADVRPAVVLGGMALLFAVGRIANGV